MALSEFELKRVEKLVGEFIQKNRPPVHIRKELDIGYRIQGAGRRNIRNPAVLEGT